MKTPNTFYWNSFETIEPKFIGYYIFKYRMDKKQKVFFFDEEICAVLMFLKPASLFNAKTNNQWQIDFITLLQGKIRVRRLIFLKSIYWKKDKHFIFRYTKMGINH